MGEAQAPLAASYALTAAVAVLLVFGASLAFLWRSAEAARATAEVARKQAVTAEEGQRKARRDVEIAQDKLVRVEYGRTMQVAYQEWREGNFDRTVALLGGIKADLREWEWKYVSRLVQGEILSLKGHTGGVASVAWSPDGSRLATAGDDRTARVWDARSGAEILTLKGHTDWVKSVSWSPDGSRLATASWDRTARVWDARSGAELWAAGWYR